MNLQEPSNTAEDRSFFQEWLEKLQQESWQLELLISGFALYGIYESKAFIDGLGHYININASYDGAVVTLGIGLSILKAGWVIFFINLLIHIILRGLWIGAIGLRYVSRDIDYEALNYSTWMTDYLRRKVGDYDSYIERLEKLCSVLFAYTFLLFFLVFSAVAFSAWLVLLSYLANEVLDKDAKVLSPQLFGIVLILYLILGLIVFFDFITLGVFKRVKDPTFSKAYGYLYRFYSFVTFSFLYRALLYNFLDNKYTRRLFLLGIPYVITVLFIAPSMYSNGNDYYPSSRQLESSEYGEALSMTVRDDLYDDLREEAIKSGRMEGRDPISYLSLDQYYQRDGHMELFLRIKKCDLKDLDASDDYMPLHQRGLQLSFLDDEVEDTVLTAIYDLGDEMMSGLVEQRKKDREQLKELGIYEGAVRDSFSAHHEMLSDSVDAIVERRARSYRADQIKDVLTYVLGKINVTIDDSTYVLDHTNSVLTQHSNLGEKGIMCHLPTRHLSHGLHRLGFERQCRPGKFSDYRSVDVSRVLPFIVEHQD